MTGGVWAERGVMGARKAILTPFPSGPRGIVSAMTDTTQVLTAEIVPSATELLVPAAAIGAAAEAAPPLLPAAERYAASQAAPSTKRTYRSTLRSFALFCERELELPATVGAVTLDTVLDYTTWLQELDEDSDEPRCHPRTVAKQLSALRGFARWLSMIPELRVDPHIQQIRVKAGPPPTPRALTPEQMRTLLRMPDRASMRGRRDRAMLEVLARAGLRRSELCALRWDDIVEVPRWPDPRLRDAVAERPADETAWALRVEHSKRGRSRLVPLARPVVAALEAWRATSASARARQRGPRPRVFVSMTRARGQDGAPLSPGAIGKIVAGYAAAAQLPRDLRSPHVLRHTFCTAIAEREGLDVVAALAGHADVRTSQRYVTVTAARTQSAIDQAFGAGSFAGGWGWRPESPAGARGLGCV
jgi:integrase/recombinase XerD